MEGTEVKSTYWEKEVVVTEIVKDEFSKYVVSACKKSGKSFVNVREWYCTRSNPNWMPAKAGMAIPVANPQVCKDVINSMADTLSGIVGGEF